MQHEIQDIPPTPRRPRWRALLWHCWPVAFLGFVFGVYGGLLTLMVSLYMGGKPRDDLRLDRGSVETTGVVQEVEGGSLDAQGRRLPMRLRYRFEAREGMELSGRSFLERPGTQVGDRIQIEFLADAPHISRAAGGRLSSTFGITLWSIFAYGVFLPGLLAIAVWFGLVLRLRRVLRYGDLAAAQVDDVRVIRFVQPGMLRVAYRFRDRRAQQIETWHWVRRRSVLGQRIEARPHRLAVVHHRDRPQLSRLVMADDFLPAAQPLAEHQEAGA